MAKRNFRVGDFVIYRKQKESVTPGPRARNLHPTEHGDHYKYTVDKFWIVADVVNDDQLLLKTRTGKEHLVSIEDFLLRRPRFWERIFYHNRFPQLEDVQPTDDSNSAEELSDEPTSDTQ